MNVLQIGADRSKRGILHAGSPAFKRQEAYARCFGHLDIIAFSLKSDYARPIDGGQLHIYPTNSFSRLLYPLDALEIARGLPKPDVVSTQDPFETGFIGWLIAWMKNAPLHVQVHTDFLSPEFARHSALNRLRVLIAGFVVRRAARVRVVSERIKRAVESRYRLGVPISVLPIFVDIEHFRYALPNLVLSERFSRFSAKLLIVSRLEPEKNVALAIRTFAEYAPENSCLIIVGEGSEREYLETLASESIGKKVFFEGAQDPAAYYKLADLVLLTSEYEGYGIVIVEALAAGKPVLSTDVGAARDLGAIVASPDDFAEKMVEWFHHGPREAHLTNYPYKSFEQYVAAYCNDIISCVQDKKGHTTAL